MFSPKHNKKILEEIKESNTLLHELLKSQKFHDTIIDSIWFKYKAISPGRGAVDYAFLYTLYKVIELMHPTMILEFGLGQSSKIIHQYAKFYEDVNALTCEHDAQWVSFFMKHIDNKFNINIQMLELIEVIYKNNKTLTYKDVEASFGNKKFDLIIVDGPYGWDYHYSRSQIIGLAETSLSQNFCILLDDYDRIGEKETGKEILDVLNKKSIKYSSTVYHGTKDHLLICSKDWSFLTLL